MMMRTRIFHLLSTSSKCVSIIRILLLHFCIISTQNTIISTKASLDNGYNNINGITNSSHYNQQFHHDEDHKPHYTDQWAVHIKGGHEIANQLASKHGFENTGQILPDYYHFVHRKVAKRSTEPCHEYRQALSSEPEVHWHAQQTVKRRIKRDFLPLNSGAGVVGRSGSSGNSRSRSSKSTKTNLITFNDPRWPAMWYLNRGGGLDMNVQEAWAEGITGKGIVVTILDDGLEKDHPDIQQNYDPLASFDVNSLDNDPMPTYDLTDSNRHGTRCAGEVAAEANNSLCAVGIAFEASVGGVRMLDGDVTDAVEARSLSHNPQHIDIYSASWGPDDDGKTVDGPGELATRAFLEGITKGRQGKGSIFVWASGNGGRDHDNCNCDGYTNSIWTLSISSATENGLVPWYSEACSSTLATTYSSGGTGEKQIVTIDLHHSCTSSHTGTSASAPLAAGICALALQANTNLTWRDMQHIVVRTARPANLIAPDWATNGVGRNVSHSFGYGLMDAGAMVKMAKRWKTVPEQNKCEVRAPYSDKNIPAKSKVTLDLKVPDCPGVNLLEHVQAKVTLTSGRRGDLQIYLVSPSGTRSVLLAHRRHDLNRSGFTDWPFMSVHNWGESPLGKWTLEIHNEGRYAGKLHSWTLVAHGITLNPNDLDSITATNTVDSAKEQVLSGTMEFDDSAKMVLGPSEIQQSNQPIAIPSAPELSNNSGDISVAHPPSNAASAASASALYVPGCVRMSMSSPGKCLECQRHLYLQEDNCISSCSQTYFIQLTSNGVKRCLPCHHSCLTCFGKNDSQCLSCFDDSTLHTAMRTVFTPSNDDPEKSSRSSQDQIQTTYKESHCYPTRLLNTIDDNELWYKALLMGVIVNVTIIIFLVFYIWLQKQRAGASINNNGNNSSNDNDDDDDSTEEDFGIDDSGGGGGGSASNGGDTSMISNGWLNSSRKIYSRVSPNDEDEINVMINSHNNTLSNNLNKAEENFPDKDDVKITISSSLKNNNAFKGIIGNNHSNSNRNNNSSHAKFKSASGEKKLIMPIPIPLNYSPSLHSKS